MRASRLLTILIVLQLRGRVSAEALARELEVSVRTVYRDIDQLGAAGVPVYAERGRHGGFALLGGFRTDLTGLTASEADAVSLIGMVQAAADLGLGDAAVSARHKVLASLPGNAAALAHRVAARVHVDPAPWYSAPATPPVLRDVAQAVWAAREIRVRYASWKGEVTRTLAPLGLVLKSGAWYLAGAAGGSTRIYRVASIREYSLTGAPALRPRGFDLVRFWTEAARDFETRLRSVTARVRLSPLGVQLLRDCNPAAAAAVDSTPRAQDGNGWIFADIPVEPLPHAVREMLRLGAEVEVIEPDALRVAIGSEAQRIARLHAAARANARLRKESRQGRTHGARK